MSTTPLLKMLKKMLYLGVVLLTIEKELGKWESV
ncbi:unknown protein [Parachlamydia acanthamoebae UV-7]|uniref:Uncharacterized protein n=2 Tax=Parachlamydia acanthamoebae TaxID=83552 RepID=F8L2I8_PARAV|nr:unknown protein [Parachlamydia acanthamoebae UV-7]